ncbi:MAG: hypothetical protein C6Y20_05465 [Tagaea sp. CACIAM 22H2]|nr:hypothetical protein [Tagaea sp. CACIAM 22H2]
MSFPIPTWLKQDDDLMLGDRPGSSDWFALSDEVGRGRINHRRDVIKVESLLNQAGLFDLEKLDGPWGYANERLDAPIKEYQKRNGLKVDGFMRPDGETINRFRQDFGDVFAEYPAPTPAMADAHHALREKGEDGLLVDRWPELKINPHPRLDPLTAGTELDEWNDSWVRHAIRANGSFEGIPVELRKNIDVDAVRGMVQARDMTRRWEAQRPGEGNQFARAMLHTLGDKPDYQSAYLASEIPQGPPIGTIRPDAAQRYAAMVEEGRAERATDAQQVTQAPGEKGTEIAQAKPPLEEMSDAELENRLRSENLNVERMTKDLGGEAKNVEQAIIARDRMLRDVNRRIREALTGGGFEGAIDENVQGTLEDMIRRHPQNIEKFLRRTFKGAMSGGAMSLAEEFVKMSEEFPPLRDREEEAIRLQNIALDELKKNMARRDAVRAEIERRKSVKQAPIEGQ